MKRLILALSAIAFGAPACATDVEEDARGDWIDARLRAENPPYPTLADIPPAPGDLRPERAWRRSVRSLDERRADVLADPAIAAPEQRSDPDTFIDEERDRALSVLDDLPDEDDDRPSFHRD